MRVSPVLAMLLTVAAAAQPWQPEEFPIGYWCGPPAAYNTLESWQTIKDCNFTWAMGAGYNTEGNKAMLDYCGQIGLKAMVIDSRVDWQMVYGEPWQDVIAQIVQEYGSHPALYGYFLRDEPNYMLFDGLGKISQELQKRDPRHLPYINLFPTYATPEQLGTPNFAEHLDKYLSIVKPAVISWDHYTLRVGGDSPDYFENLGLIRDASLRSGAPGWNIIQAMSYDPSIRQPTDAEMRWQVYTSLAYGIKGIMYFVYWSYTDEPQFVGIVDAQGKPARLYPIVQKLNAEMKALGKVLLGLTSTGVYHTGPTPQGATRLGTDSLIALPQEVPLVIGFFNQTAGDARYAMVVNSSYSEPVDFAASLRPSVTGLTEITPDGLREVPIEVAEGQAKLHLEPGEGKLFRLETEFIYPAVPDPITRIDFQFNTDGDAEGWGEPSCIEGQTVRDGVMGLTLTGPDPYVSRRWLHLAPDQYTKIRLRMKLPECEPTAQFFFTIAEEMGFADDKYIPFAVIPDGEWHEYEIPVADHPKWKGHAVRGIRLDPTAAGVVPGTKVEIDWIVGE